ACPADGRPDPTTGTGSYLAIKGGGPADWSRYIPRYLLPSPTLHLRILRKSPGFTTVAVLTLALGIGATTAMFSVVDGVLLRPLPYPQPGRLVEVGLDLPGINQFNWPLCPADYFTFREQSRTFQDIGLYYTGFGAALYSANVTGRGRPEHVPAPGVTAGGLPILGVTPLLGRSFT